MISWDDGSSWLVTYGQADRESPLDGDGWSPTSSAAADGGSVPDYVDNEGNGPP